MRDITETELAIQSKYKLSDLQLRAFLALSGGSGSIVSSENMAKSVGHEPTGEKASSMTRVIIAQLSKKIGADYAVKNVRGRGYHMHYKHTPLRDRFEKAYAIAFMQDANELRKMREGSGYFTGNDHLHDCWRMFYTGWAMSDE
jgi:hypothetical protein